MHTGDPTAMADAAVADAAERLMRELPQRDPHHVATTVLACARDLSGTPVAALPELVERLARERLNHP